MTRCCTCMRWFHVECVEDAGHQESWNCSVCRSAARCIMQLMTSVENLRSKLIDVTDALNVMRDECNDLNVQNDQLQAELNRTTKQKCSDVVVIGDSLLKDIDPKSLLTQKLCQSQEQKWKMECNDGDPTRNKSKKKSAKSTERVQEIPEATKHTGNSNGATDDWLPARSKRSTGKQKRQDPKSTFSYTECRTVMGVLQKKFTRIHGLAAKKKSISDRERSENEENRLVRRV
ncbi:hypothetical protein CAPTEDRAFT_212457 [Capitella teleta]|uniref:Uncharacterized protein n=1 Tax=Capitella teleta TaxID=283909 RepID=R7USA2_CAPTE|nr:hypothetical protein CAPTEDRAFT_212457 [Capitella teleta]|eukprot:ELU06291.1 hypothetical protein CAPTEDRAFT_212457 [Capitella teleta]